jgi:YHS domain-containing protein
MNRFISFVVRRLGKLSALLSIITIVSTLSACSAISAQNKGDGYKPVNATPDEQDNALMLKGFDVVSYFVDSKHEMGIAQHRTNYKGITFQFASAEHKALFEKEPGKYLPEFGGYCANGIVYGIPWGGDGDTWKIIDGKLYIFGGAGSRDAFLIDEKANIALAQKYWQEEISGSNSFWQRSKRMTFRVPHYKSGEALAKEVADAKAKGVLPKG